MKSEDKNTKESPDLSAEEDSRQSTDDQSERQASKEAVTDSPGGPRERRSHAVNQTELHYPYDIVLNLEFTWGD